MRKKLSKKFSKEEWTEDSTRISGIV